jgi:hypothetical protein
VGEGLRVRDHLIHPNNGVARALPPAEPDEEPPERTLGRLTGALCPTNLPMGWISKVLVMMHSSRQI